MNYTSNVPTPQELNLDSPWLTRGGAVIRAAELIDRAGVATMVEAWALEDGAAVDDDALPTRAVLIGWLALAFTGTPLTTRNLVQLLGANLHPDVADALGFVAWPDSARPRTTHKRVASTTWRVLNMMDDRPLPVGAGRLTRAQYAGAVQDRELRAAELERKRVRLDRFRNAILQAQYDGLPAAIRSNEVSLSIDGFFRSAGVEGTRRAASDELRDDELVSAEPDAGFLMSAAPNIGRATRLYNYGWEHELAVLFANESAPWNAVPPMVIGIATHKPGLAPALYARRVLDDIRGRGLTLGRVVADCAYFPNASPHVLQNHLRAHGAKLVMAYPTVDEGRVLATAGDRVLIEGAWYSRDLPAYLRTAMRDFNTTWKGIRATNSFDLGRREELHHTLRNRRDALLSRRRAYEIAGPSDKDSPDRAAAYMQHYRYGSPDWYRAYNDGRRVLERFMSILRRNDTTFTAKDIQFKGQTAHAFLTTLVVAAANEQSIAEWMALRAPATTDITLGDAYAEMWAALSNRITDGMNAWSRRTQPCRVAHADQSDDHGYLGGHWEIRPDESDETFDWKPDDAATVIQMRVVDEAAVDGLANPIIDSLTRQAEELIARQSATGNSMRKESDLSHDVRVVLRLEYIGINALDEWDDPVAVPTSGAKLAAQATIVPRDVKDKWLPSGQPLRCPALTV